MEFIIAKKDLVRELHTVTGVVEKRATLPILANLLIETTSDGIQVGASDLEVTIRGTAKATVKKEGSVTLPAAKLHEIARSLPDADVQFKLMERNQVAITCKRTRYRIAGQSKEDFPKFPDLDVSSGLKLPTAAVGEMIERVAFAITTEDPRYSLNGALMLIKDGGLTFVATDGHRLAFIERNAGIDASQEIRVIVPRKALSEVAKLTAEDGTAGDIRFGRAGNHIFFVIGEHLLTSTILEGNFPRYENVIPKESRVGLVLNNAELAHAVKRVSLLATDRVGRAIRFSLGDGKLELSSETEMGEAHEEIEIQYDSDPMEIGFNARYLLDFLGVVGTDSVRLELNPSGDDGGGAGAGDKPGQFKPEPSGDVDYRYIVMPMHL